MSGKNLLYALLLFTGTLLSCDRKQDIQPEDSPYEYIQNTATSSVFYGPSQPLGPGVARTWIETTHAGQPVAIGLNFSSKVSLENLPKQQEMYHLKFHGQAVFAPFVGMMFDWNPEGHIPLDLYEKPHFDIHFYMVSDEEHMNIPLGVDYPHADWFERDYMPSNYTSLRLAIPGMGNHWVDEGAPEMTGEGFSKTLILGAYEDKQTFIEPMITLGYFQQLKPNETVTAPVSEFPKVQKSGYYPTKYTITYDPVPGVYKVALTDLVYRRAE
ncbi:hypothetical protein [Pontibacter sp. SGAir0037]|uniref:hypothetical protein n=1 Tax=Pontibacter sp. SGAir0037 TaxID=2571030 RepID=UPI0010CCFBE4|nr:hypothetical protein [Pontibacter sp. SGAir0037]QCR23849.1 hypothetical protein C1N53_16835 [Pontibacter sp. SGAir0037]